MPYELSILPHTNYCNFWNLFDITIDPFWIESLQTNLNVEIIFPPILRLKLNEEELALENDSLEIIKAYSNDFIEFIINDKKKYK